MRAVLARPARVVAVVAVFLAAGAAASVVATSHHAPGTRSAEISYVTDFADDRRLAGFADDVFLGTVVAQVGAEPAGHIPQSQFTVRVVRALKGDLSGEVVVNQQGGIDRYGELTLVEHDPLLTPGATYLFATRHNARFGHTPVPVFGDLRVTDAAAQAALVARFTAAIANEIPYAVR